MLILLFNPRFKNIFNHGDVWTNNLLFRYQDGKPVEARIIDFQLTRYIPLAHDLLEVFFLTTDKAFRDKYEKQLQKYYYQHLQKELERYGYSLEKIMTWTSFTESWYYYKKLGLVRAAIMLHVVLTPLSVKEEAFAKEDGYSNFILKKRGYYIKECFRFEPYKKRMSEIFHELIEKYVPL